MAQRRMFNRSITNSSEFLMMSQSSQSLYFHLGMNADDDGFCEVFTIMRMTESKPDDLKSLHERGLIFVVDSKVCIVKDWHQNNQLRKDRYTKSKYLEIEQYKDVYMQVMEEKIRDISLYQDVLSGGKPNGNQMAPQYSIGKVSIDKVSIEVTTPFEDFWSIYPKKIEKKKSRDKWNKINVTTQKEIIEHLKVRVEKDAQWKKGYVLNPTTFLNGSRWEDNYEIAKKINNKTLRN